MKLILRASVERLGKIGDVVEVPDGYARNYLLPNRFAMAATPDNRKRIEAEKKRATAREAARIASLTELAEAVDGKSVTIAVKATEDNKLYGSVGPEEIAEAAKAEQNLVIDPDHVMLEEPIKVLGVYEVNLQFTAEAKAVLKVWVVGE